MSTPQHSDSDSNKNNNSKTDELSNTGELKKTEDPIERIEKNERNEKRHFRSN